MKRKYHANELRAIVSTLSRSDRKKFQKKAQALMGQGLDSEVATVKTLVQMGILQAQDEEDTLRVQVPSTPRPKPEPTSPYNPPKGPIDKRKRFDADR